MIVVDTNIIGYLYLTGDYSSQAEQALQKDPLWAAPLSWRSELRNVMAFYLRKNLLTLREAQEIMDEAQRLMQGREYDVRSQDVLRLVAGSTCSAYDCEFIALAEDLGVPLVTVDKHLISQFPDSVTSLEKFLSG